MNFPLGINNKIIPIPILSHVHSAVNDLEVNTSVNSPQALSEGHTVRTV